LQAFCALLRGYDNLFKLGSVAPLEIVAMANARPLSLRNELFFMDFPSLVLETAVLPHF